MFAWICPDCGRECLPSESECPRCAQKAKEKEAAPAAPAAQPSTTGAAAQPAVPPPLPRQRSGLPTWLMSIVFTLAFGGLLAGGYWGYQQYKTGKSPAEPETAITPVAHDPAASKPSTDSALLRQLEVAGLRLVQSKDKKVQIHFLVVNHSAADLGEINGTLKLLAKDAPVGSTDFKISSLGPYEAKEVDTPLATQLKVYELPDWQYLRGVLSLKAP